MKYIGKSLSAVLIVAILVAAVFIPVQADMGIIYESSSKETITSGVSLEKISRFTNDGWLNIRVLRVDLTNENVNVDTISNTTSLKNLSNVKTFAQSRGAVAAINGSFFNWLSGSSSGYPDGPIVESGKIITAASEYNRYQDSMASLSIDTLNRVMYNYWKTNITLTALNGNSTAVGQYNKPSRDYTDFTIMDRRWSESSMGASAQYPDMIEVVVDDGTITEIRTAQPAVQIPVNGYVIVTRQAGGQFINGNFQIGDPVDLKISTTPDWSNLKMSVTGGAMLVKDGQIPAQFSHNIGGRNPRTSIGTSSDGNTLYMVTVDGRENYNVGMTQTEMAQLMLSLGAFNALNLDGGGSTTMVARDPVTSDINVVNSPSDSYPRGVATAVGVFSIAPTSPLDTLLIDTADTNVFVNTSREFIIRGVDRYYNPVQVDASSVKWSVSGVQGSFVGNVFYPKSVGEAKIKASIGNISAEIAVSVLSSPVQLDLGSTTLSLGPNQSKSVSVSGKNANGYHALINPTDVIWSVNGSIGSIKDGTFTASSIGQGYIVASMGDVRSYCGVAVSSDGKQAASIQLPKNTEPADEANKAVDYSAAPDSFRFSVMGQYGAPKNLLEKLLYQNLSEKVNSYIDLAAFVGSTTADVTTLVKTPVVSTAAGYKSIDFKNSRFIQLDASKQGLRTSATGQWQWLLQQLETAKGSNIFIFLPQSQWAFSDKLETSLFQEVLTKYRQTTGKNIWVFFRGSTSMSYMERGVKYIATPGLAVEGLSPSKIELGKYMLVTVKGNGVTYEYKPIVP